MNYLITYSVPFGKGNGNPLQYCSMDRGAMATVHEVTKSQTQLSVCPYSVCTYSTLLYSFP